MLKSSRKKDSCVVPFRQTLTGPMAAGVAGFAANPTGITGRILIEADAWAHFRWLALRYRLRRVGTVASVQVLAYLGGVEDTSPSTIAQGSEVLTSTILAGTDTVPSPWVSPSPAELAGPLPWYKTIPGTADATEEAPGNFSITGTGTETWFVEIEGTIMFKVSVAAGNTPEELALRTQLHRIRYLAHMAKARDTALRVLAPGGSLVPSAFPCSTLKPN